MSQLELDLGTPRHTCPRRAEQGLDRDDTPFMNSGTNKDVWREDDTCSWCGSFNPDALMKLLEEQAVELEPTDKSYKAYVCSPDRKFRKFYFQHLSVEQQARFVELYNAGMKLTMPGHFYVMPFFMRRAKQP